MKKKFYFLSFMVELIQLVFLNSFAAALLKDGTSLGSIAVSLAVFFLVKALLDYPTGVMADKFGQKKISVIGVALTGVGYLGLYFSSVAGAALLWGSFGIIAAGSSSISGAFVSWGLSLRSNCFREVSRESFSRAYEIVGRFGTLAGSLLMIYVFNFHEDHIAVLWIFLVALSLFSVGLSLFIPKDKHEREAEEGRFVLTGGRLKTIFKNRGVPVILLVAFLYGIEMGLRSLFIQPHILNLEGELNFIAYFSIAMGLVRLLGLYLYPLVRRKITKEKVYGYSLALFGVAEIICYWLQDFWSFVLVYSFGVLVLAFHFVLKIDILGGIVDGSQRATLFSVESSISNLTAAALLAFIGLSSISAEGLMPKFWLLGGALIVFGGFLLQKCVFDVQEA